MQYKHNFFFADNIDSEHLVEPTDSSRIVIVELENGPQHIAISKYYNMIDLINKDFYDLLDDYTFHVTESWVMNKILEHKIVCDFNDYDCEIVHKYICTREWEHWLHRQENNDSLLNISNMLKEHGVEINISGCGCCDSPWVDISIDGKLIVDDEQNFNITMIKVKKINDLFN